jgi:hypothetical protein
MRELEVLVEDFRGGDAPKEYLYLRGISWDSQ